MIPGKANLDRGFTDAQLERIKGACIGSISEYGNQDAKEILALLHRLHAAERFIQLGSQEQSVNPIELKQAEERWLRSKGLPPLRGRGEA